jgi:hypothetical protein
MQHFNPATAVVRYWMKGKRGWCSCRKTGQDKDTQKMWVVT